MTGNTPRPSVIAGARARPGALLDFCSRHYAILAALVLGLAAFNLTFRLGHEFVNEWDESLYAISAWEMTRSGHWIATTFLGTLDYYNAKPPLNVWLIALSFEALGPGLVSLRLASALSAWATVAVLVGWARRSFGPAVALAAGLVLATSFGFLHVHSGRSANTDALFTLLTLLTAVALWAAQRRRWRLAWLGPVAAAVFLLRGMAVIMPLAIVVPVAAWARGRRAGWRGPAAMATLLFAVPVAGWLAARWQVDQWQFLERLFLYDFVARSVEVIEEHAGTPLYHLNILVKHHYDWILAALAALVLFPVPRPRLGSLRSIWRDDDGLAVVLASWAGATLVIPALIRTKLPWYLNPFYPVFALAVAWTLVHAVSRAGSERQDRRRLAVLGAIVVLALVVAEGKLLSYSYRYRDLGRSTQGLLLAEGARLAGHRVFSDRLDRAEVFVAQALLGAEHRLVADLGEFLRESRPGDYVLSRERHEHPGLTLAQSGPRFWLYRRHE